MGFRETKAMGKRAVHDTMKQPASYYASPADALPVLIHARPHTKWLETGDLKGTNLSYAETEERSPRVIIDRLELDNPPSGGYIIFAADEGYRVTTTEPPDGEFRAVNVVPLTPAQLAGRMLPGDIP